MRYMIDADMDKYFCAILSDDKEYDFDKQAVRVEKEDYMVLKVIIFR